MITGLPPIPAEAEQQTWSGRAGFRFRQHDRRRYRHGLNDHPFNTAVTKTASEILGKHRQKKKKTWLNAEILDLCDKRRELRKKRFEPEGSEKYKEVNNNIKRCMKKAKENWIGEQSSGIEENLRKNNSKRTYQLVKDLTTLKEGKATTVQDRSGKCLTE